MSEELKPCPFCGSPFAEIQQYVAEPGLWWRVECASCCAKSPGAKYPADAIAAWNRRASPTTEGERNEAIEAAKRIVGTVAEADAMIVARYLLSCPLIKNVRREALEEAAKIAEGYFHDLSNPTFARACAGNIATRIRALATEGSKP